MNLEKLKRLAEYRSRKLKELGRILSIESRMRASLSRAGGLPK